MTALEGHWFGLKPDVEPLPALYWGGRALFHPPGGIDILWDRQQYNTVDEAVKKDRDALWKWIQEKGLPRLRTELAAKRISQRDETTIRVTDRGYVMTANPKRSYGYLYIGAWRNEGNR